MTAASDESLAHEVGEATKWARYPLGMRYESRAYGTRQEIVAHITKSAKSPGRSERRMREGAKAVVQLEDGWDQVEYGQTVYVVEEPPQG